jgi:hypothetical protein
MGGGRRTPVGVGVRPRKRWRWVTAWTSTTAMVPGSGKSLKPWTSQDAHLCFVVRQGPIGGELGGAVSRRR